MSTPTENTLTAYFDRALVRKEEFGNLGSSLYYTLKAHARDLRFLIGLDFPRQLSAFESRVSALAGLHPLLPPAISLLCFDYPFQLASHPQLTRRLMTVAYQVDDSPTNPHPPDIAHELMGQRVSYTAYCKRLITDKEFRDTVFPRKSHPGATTKPVVGLSGLVRGLSTLYGPHEAGRIVAYLPAGTPRDVAICHILYSHALRPHLSKDSAIVSARAITRPKEAKGLSNALKALGLNATALGACLTEAQTMQGRAVGAINWEVELAKRCDPDTVSKLTVNFTPEELAPHIEAILDEELPRGFTLPDLDDYWTSRWAWCVNGSHSADSSRALGIPADTFPGFDRTYRRMASEFLDSEPITAWDGTTYVSKSEKLEHGKTRAIFACDTRSYFAWSWPLNAIQRAWKNKRVLLDPGSGGMSGIASRVQGASRRPGINLMLDFEDFNSHHTTSLMQLTTRLALARGGAPTWLIDKLVNSLDMEYIRVGKELRHVKGTLMSGHRGTTFFNSVLNAAYFRAAAGPDLYNRIFSVHTGDDVYSRVFSYHDVGLILSRLDDRGCRLNPSKQSIGHANSEFLRCAFSPARAWGYVARSIATCASGSWTNSDPLAPRERFLTAISTVRSLINRSGQESFPRLVAPAMRLPKGIGVRQAIEAIVGGRAAFGDGPVYNVAAPFPRYVLVEDERLEAPAKLESLPSNATKQYLTRHLSPVEIEALTLAKVDPQPLLTASSYSKGQVEGKTAPPASRLVRKGDYKPRSPGLASDVKPGEHTAGVLNPYPIIQLLKDSLTTPQIVALLDFIGYDPGPNPRRTAFGSEATPTLITGILPYSDASSIARATGYDHIYVVYPIGM
jgi:hypothetical protein